MEQYIFCFLHKFRARVGEGAAATATITAQHAPLAKRRKEGRKEGRKRSHAKTITHSQGRESLHSGYSIGIMDLGQRYYSSGSLYGTGSFRLLRGQFLASLIC